MKSHPDLAYVTVELVIARTDLATVNPDVEIAVVNPEVEDVVINRNDDLVVVDLVLEEVLIDPGDDLVVVDPALDEVVIDPRDENCSYWRNLIGETSFQADLLAIARRLMPIPRAYTDLTVCSFPFSVSRRTVKGWGQWLSRSAVPNVKETRTVGKPLPPWCSTQGHQPKHLEPDRSPAPKAGFGLRRKCSIFNCLHFNQMAPAY